MPTAANAGGSTTATGDDSRGRAIAKPVSAVHGRRHVVPADRHPRKVAGTYTYIQNVRVPGMLHARRVRPRGAGANTVENDYAAQRRPELDRPHPGRPGRPDRQLPRRRRSEGVRRDPGGGAAEGGLEDGDRVPGGSGNYWSWLRAGRRHQHGQPAPLHDADTGNVPAALAARGEDGLCDLPATTTTPSCRSGRTARSPTCNPTTRRRSSTSRPGDSTGLSRRRSPA